jgi:ribose transport system permease protein
MNTAAERTLTTTSPPRARALYKYSTLLALLVMIVAFSFFIDRFMTTRNVVNILQQISMLTIVAIGLTFALATRELDLSVGNVAGLAGIVTTLALVSGTPLPLAVLLGLGVGLAFGVTNALLVTIVGIPSLIATLAAGSIAYGVNFWVSGGRAIYGGLPSTFVFWGQGTFGIMPVVALIMLSIVLLSYFVLNHTLAGRYLYAVGANVTAARLAGIKVKVYKGLGLAVSAVFASGAGILLAARLGSGQPGAGERYLMDGLAAVFIGMTMFRPGVATVGGTLFGALFIGVLNNGLNLLGLDFYIQNIAKGVVMLLAVSIVSRQTTVRLL